MTTSAFNADDHELLKEPTLDTQFPISFKTGFKFTGMQGQCSMCHKQIGSEHIHGRMQQHTLSMVEVRALGKCQGCNIYTRFHYRVYDDHRFMLHLNTGWEEYSMQLNRADRVTNKIKKAFKWLFTF